MSFELSYKDLKKEMLSEKALELMADFISIWETKTGELIDIDSDDIVVQVLRRAKGSRSRHLRAIYLHLRAESTNIIQNSAVSCDEMLADQLMCLIAKGRSCMVPGQRVAA